MVKKRSKSSKKKEKCPKTSSHLPSPAPGLVEVFSTLEKRYGTPQLKEKLDPLDSLILTILSQNTTDTNSDRSFAALKAKFPTWLEVAHADESSIEKAIRCGGLAKIKAKNIRTILLDLEQRANGAPSLDYMATMSDKDVFSELTKMKGVGPKTAACVLLFSMGRNAFPVDTHVHRVSRRLGLVSFDSSREQTQEKLEGKVPTDWMYKGHLLLIQHGRQVCHSQRPLCQNCVLCAMCPKIGVDAVDVEDIICNTKGSEEEDYEPEKTHARKKRKIH